jgi:hypothetical protein
MVINLGVPKHIGKIFSSCTTGGSSRRADVREVIGVKKGLRSRIDSTGSWRVLYYYWY